MTEHGNWDDLLAHSDEAAERIGQELLQHPLAQRHALKAVATGNNRIYTPADVLGERLARIGALLLISSIQPDELTMNLIDKAGAKSAAMLTIAHAALKAHPFLWTEDARGAAREALGPHNSKLPRHIVSPRILPQPRMWWTWETGIGISDGVTVDANVLIDYGDQFQYAAIGEINGKPFVEGVPIKYGQTFPDDYADTPFATRITEAIGLLSFLNSPYIPKQTGRLTRPERRSVTRAGAEDYGDEISWVILRRPAPGRTHEEAEDPDTLNWKHRWVVSGHYRAQWYPTEQAHHLIWIAPYLKGPEDAPLLEHAYKVAR